MLQERGRKCPSLCLFYASRPRGALFPFSPVEMRAVWEAGEGAPAGKSPQQPTRRQPVWLGVFAMVPGSQPAEPVDHSSTGLVLTASRSLCTAALGYMGQGGVPHVPAPGGRGLSAPEWK